MLCSGLADREAKETARLDRCDSLKERVDIVTLAIRRLPVWTVVPFSGALKPRQNIEVPIVFFIN